MFLFHDFYSFFSLGACCVAGIAGWYSCSRIFRVASWYSWLVFKILLCSMGYHCETACTHGNKLVNRAQYKQDLFRLFPSTEMRYHHFAACDAWWEQCGSIPEIDAHDEGPKLIKNIDQMSLKAHEDFGWNQLKDFLIMVFINRQD